ncbi:hypothetical protein AB0B45_05575 [Nonomuraea sp. NPDC049152]|uniref:hypothetical protein n=1 Tax=Nonomuraea sp. NPDC049152 TaxID=3154350 RepID=UPI0033DF8F14
MSRRPRSDEHARTTMFATVPNVGACLRGIHSSSTRTPRTALIVPKLSEVWCSSPSYRTLQGLTPSDARTMAERLNP